LRRGPTAAITAAILLFSPLTGAPAGAAGPAPTPGTAGVGDTYYPDYGNGGYDVSHYDVRLRYDPATDRLAGTTTILARTTHDLSRFNLDFALAVSSVRVNGHVASFTREGSHELVVTPARAVGAGCLLTVVVQYADVPSTVVVNGFTSWTRTADGALAVNEPEIAWWWFPSNDHPLDKATFDVSVLVPSDVEVVSNGVQPLPPRTELIGWTRWFWRTTSPIATYLAFIVIGQYEIVTQTAPNGQPVVTAYSERLGDLSPAAHASISRTAEVIEWESSMLGPYPFEAQGGVAGPPDGIRFALENATRPVYGWRFWAGGSNPYVIVHELAHQWFGDSVSVAQWHDIWLNEGFASYLAWLWSEEHGEGTAQELFDYTYGSYAVDDPFWQVLPGDPGADDLFDAAVYDRGAMTLHQLRLAVGDTAFFEILRTWVADHGTGNGTTAQFVALAEEFSGRDLSALFTTWLFTAGRPTVAAAGPATLAARGIPASIPASIPLIRRGRAADQHRPARVSP
jgi:aminopeptidase N